MKFQLVRHAALGLEQPLAAGGLVAHVLQQRRHPFEVERLGQVIARAELDGLDRALDRRAAAHQHHIAGRKRVADLTKQVDTVGLRHQQIDEGDIGRTFGHPRNRLGGGFARDDVESRRLRQTLHNRAHHRLVVDDEQDGARRHAGLLTGPGR